MYVVFLIYCSFFVLFVLLQLVSYPYFITDYLFIFSEVEFLRVELSWGGGVDQEPFWNRIVTPRIGIGSDREVTNDSHP